jgi:cysteine-rich repeat protein
MTRALRPALLAAPLLLAASMAFAATANTPNDLCPGLPDPCEVTGSWTVPGTNIVTFDFGTRALVLKQGAKIDFGQNDFRIVAGSVTLEPKAALVGGGGLLSVDALGDIRVQKAGSNGAKIDVNASFPGTVTLAAGGRVQIDGTITANATGEESGGDVNVAAGDIVITGGIEARGGNKPLTSGGAVELISDSTITFSGTMDLTGQDLGGSFAALSDDDMTINGTLDLQAKASDGSGGSIELDSTDGRIVLGAETRLQGKAGGEFGGDGGDLSIVAFSGTVELRGVVNVTGGGPAGSGGDVDISAAEDFIQTAGSAINGATVGIETTGPLVQIDAGRHAVLGNIDGRGSTGFGGGEIDISSQCDLTVPGGRVIDARGAGGRIRLSSGGQITVAGTLRATDSNELRWLTKEPIITTGASIVPAVPTDEQGKVGTMDPTIVPCGGIGCGNDFVDTDEECDGTLTGVCGAGVTCSEQCRCQICGNGILDPGEECDDGNTEDGDGCAADCSRFTNVCGDDVQDNLEACDDGNTDSCDGCSASCEVEMCGNGVVDCNEECDDGPGGSLTCSAQCVKQAPPGCGNGQPDPGEQCDDGNTDPCDGCNAFCELEGCGNGVVECGETCDDFNTESCDGCSATCQTEVCGNGVAECAEACDDGAGNGVAPSNCLADLCEIGELCTPDSTGPCIQCADTSDCTPLGACGDAACVAGICTPVDPPSCDDGNACTEDVCSPASGCVNTPITCDDGQTCNGTETCDPDVGCVAGTAPQCDDGDLCTDDMCTDGAGCENVPKIGIASVVCRLDTASAIVSGAQLGKKAAKKLPKSLTQIRTKVNTVGSSSGKKAKKAQKVATKKLRALGKYVQKQSGKQIPADVATDLGAAITGASGALSGLTL